MALQTLGSTEIKADLNKVMAKTAIEKNYIADVWFFRVLLDGTWFLLEYSSLAAAQVDYNSFT